MIHFRAGHSRYRGLNGYSTEVVERYVAGFVRKTSAVRSGKSNRMADLLKSLLAICLTLSIVDVAAASSLADLLPTQIDPRGPIRNVRMRVTVAPGSVQARGYVFRNDCSKPGSMERKLDMAEHKRNARSRKHLSWGCFARRFGSRRGTSESTDLGQRRWRCIASMLTANS